MRSKTIHSSVKRKLMWRERVRKQDWKMGVYCKDNIRVIIGRE